MRGTRRSCPWTFDRNPHETRSNIHPRRAGRCERPPGGWRYSHVSGPRKPSRLRPALILAALSLALALAGPAQAGQARGCGPIAAEAGEVRGVTLERTTLCLLNRERAKQRMRPLRTNRRLRTAGLRHAQDMIRRRYFSHHTLEGVHFVTRVRATGYLRRARRWAVGENIAWGKQRRSTPAWVVRKWMRSPTHRANILNPRFREIGVAVAWGAPERGVRGPAATYATEFGVARR
jgi:uncharacterized protein YkwD